MPPPTDHPAFNLKVLPKTFFVKQLPSHEALSVEVLGALNSSHGFFSITRTTEEISIVGEITESTPSSLDLSDGGWRCIQIAGPMNFGSL